MCTSVCLWEGITQQTWTEETWLVPGKGLFHDWHWAAGASWLRRMFCTPKFFSLLTEEELQVHGNDL
jgi:hypothetical protein